MAKYKSPFKKSGPIFASPGRGSIVVSGGDRLGAMAATAQARKERGVDFVTDRVDRPVAKHEIGRIRVATTEVHGIVDLPRRGGIIDRVVGIPIKQ